MVLLIVDVRADKLPGEPVIPQKRLLYSNHGHTYDLITSRIRHTVHGLIGVFTFHPFLASFTNFITLLGEDAGQQAPFLIHLQLPDYPENH